MSLNRDNQHARVYEVLRQMIAHAETLARIISEEGIALRDANIEVLNDKVQSKKQIVDALSRLDTNFRSILEQLGLQKNAEILNFLASHLQDSDLLHDWHNYVRLMSECDKQNHANSTLVNVGLRHTKQAIEFLKSCIGQQTDSVYAPPYMQRPGISSTGRFVAKA